MYWCTDPDQTLPLRPAPGGKKLSQAVQENGSGEGPRVGGRGAGGQARSIIISTRELGTAAQLPRPEWLLPLLLLPPFPPFCHHPCPCVTAGYP